MGIQSERIKVDLDQLRELAVKELTWQEISDLMGVTISTLQARCKKYNISVKLKKIKATDSELINKISILHAQGKTNPQIAAELGISPSTSRKYTRQILGTEINSNTALHIYNKELTLSQIQLEVIYGGILGDMCLMPMDKFARLSINQGGQHESYFDYLCTYFDGLLGKISKTPRFDNRTQKYYNKFVVRTLSHSVYLDLYNECYQNGIKILTKEWLDKLSPLSIAIWFMDDGSLRGIFATNGFTYNEVSLLQEMFITRFNIKTRLYKVPNKEQWTLMTLKEDVKKLEDLIRPYIIPDMMYKLKYK